MSYSLYQNKAWEIMQGKVNNLENKELAEQIQKLMSESASEAFKKPTKSEDVADLMADAVNSSIFDNEAFAKQITQRTHRTLQQSFMRALKTVFASWTEMEKDGWYDHRNEATVKASKKVNEVLKDEYFPMI